VSVATQQEIFRPLCTRCLRPESACWCRALPGIETQTRIVFLQHPRERYVAIGTARMAHLALPSSRFFRGIDFSDNTELQTIAADPHAAILFPASDARDLRTLEEMPRTLVVVDGTWPQARKLWQRNAVLQRLPRVGFVPTRPGNYRIRKEPAAHCLSTIEAVVEALGIIEGDPARFEPMLDAFARMIDLQIARTETRTTGPRRREKRRPPRPPPLPPELNERAQDLVVVYAESNAHPLGTVPELPAELIHFAAVRVATGETFEALIAPRLPLAGSTPHHLQIASDAILAGEPLELARQRWRAFLRETDLLTGWGYFSLNLLRDAELALGEALDLRPAVARLLKRRAGGIEAAAAMLKSAPAAAPVARGRAGVRTEALVRVVQTLQAAMASPLRA
jgi:DTW domain-containing protein YfiP